MERLKRCFAALLVALLLSLTQGQATVSVSRMAEAQHIPATHCSSPGWRETPHDTTTVIGSHVFFNCRSTITHKGTVWLVGGEEINKSSPLAERMRIYNGDTSLKFGPIEAEDDGLVFGCKVKTKYGYLPSKTGRVTVMSAPKYSTVEEQVAYVDEPFEFDFNYMAKSPPSMYSWYKNGRPYKADGGRVTADHTGMIFMQVLHEDAGEYTVQAYTPRTGVSTRASSTLKVRRKDSQHGSPVLSTRLAVSVSLNQTHGDYVHSPYLVKTTSPTHASSNYAKHVFRLIRNFKKPSPISRQQGLARLESERILDSIHNLIGAQNDLHLSEDIFEKIADHTNCTSCKRYINCFSYNNLKYRTINGTCNNFFYPLNGAAKTPFARILPANYEDGIALPVGHNQATSGDFFSPPWPSARLISWRIIQDLKSDNHDDVSVMFMQWGQFLDHDLDIAPLFEEENCSCEYTKRCIPIEVKPEDTIFGTISSNRGRCLPFMRSVPACTCEGQSPLPRNQINDDTSYIDASNIYGSDDKLANELRLFKGGLLKQGGRLNSLKGNLPVQEDTPENSSLPFFVAGDSRSNEQIGLTIMHTIWLREHNRLARQLSKINPCWDDERIYQETRKIVGAMNQVIVYEEFLPVLFGRHLRTYVPSYKGYDPSVDSTIPNSFATAAYRFGHSLIKDRFDRLDKNFRRLDIGPLPLRRAFFNPIVYYESMGTDPILRGMLVNETNPVDEFLNTVLTSQLFAESDKKLGGDLATLNIQRGRDHGLPTYRTWQKHCRRLFPGIKPQFKRQETVDKLKELYGREGFEEGIDLWVGGLAEKRLPGAQVGPTFACIFGITFSRLRDGDRFFYKNHHHFTPYQRLELKKTTLAKVICNNADDIPMVQRSVFRVGGERVKCSTIPEINLNKWWDRRCYNRYHKARG